MTSTTASAGRVARDADEVLRSIVDAALGAERLAGPALLVGAGRGEHLGAECPRQLNRRGADPARAAVDQETFARTQPAAVEDVRPHGEERLGNRRGLDQAQRSGNRQALHGRHGAELGIAASRGEGAHAIPCAPAGHIRAHGRNRSGDFESRHVRDARGRGIESPALQNIRTIDTGRRDADEHIAGAGTGAGRSASARTSGPPGRTIVTARTCTIPIMFPRILRGRLSPSVLQSLNPSGPSVLRGHNPGAKIGGCTMRRFTPIAHPTAPLRPAGAARSARAGPNWRRSCVSPGPSSWPKSAGCRWGSSTR